jgi:hypothetical protein
MRPARRGPFAAASAAGAVQVSSARAAAAVGAPRCYHDVRPRVARSARTRHRCEDPGKGTPAVAIFSLVARMSPVVGVA